MATSRLILSCLTFALLAPVGCDRAAQPANDVGSEDRGPIGKADLTGSCADSCGGLSDGNCWCDESCHDFGDCCTDKEEMCGGGEPPACAGENPAGCFDDSECGDGETCTTEHDECIASGCGCDAETGAWICTADCNGGLCVPEEPTCEGENPAGCSDDSECGDGQTCTTEHDECIPSGCGCDPATGSWLCTADCSGGLCVPDEEEPACEGEDPSQVCSDDPSACIPSACACDPALGVWNCTPDCGGGQNC